MTIEVTIKTNKGEINIDLYEDKVPYTVANFVNLASRGFYDGIAFHRVIPNFMIQGGCPLGQGTGGPGYRFGDEFHPELRHDAAGILSMANAGPSTNGSQFFICHGPQPHLNDAHAVFGAVQSDEDQAVVNAIEGGDIMESVTVKTDWTALREQCADALSGWNETLNAQFPNLKAAQ